MGEEPAKAEPERYRAFISYSHGDARFAHWLHRKLESWRLPGKSRLTPVFIDRAELAAGSDLSAQVREALEQSAALVVVCSPNARASRWVGQEIALFRTLHPDRPVLAALIEGEPDAAFPEALLGTGDAPLEPLAADFRKGHDGQRLGLLKLAAGLTALPLDRLVQRDAQARQRRVMAITAAALALVLVLSAALVIALRARAEAERQRAEAEGLVEFMLTDLRDKLKGVGRLDVMDAVNAKVVLRYSGHSQQNFPDEVLVRRVRLFQAMAEDDLSSIERFDRGVEEAEAAARISVDLVKRNPSSSEFLLSHAKSEYWLGEARYRGKRGTPKTRSVSAYPHWQRYRDITFNLSERADAKPEWIVEAGYAEGNLCVLALSAPANPSKALSHCKAATNRLELARSRKPGDIDISLNLASAYAWQSDAELANGNQTEAVKLRKAQQSLVDQLASLFPQDKRIMEAQMLADIGLAKLLIAMGDVTRARLILTTANTRARRLQVHDPGNQDWAGWLRQIENLMQ
jgi:hypothetical protein